MKSWAGTAAGVVAIATRDPRGVNFRPQDQRIRDIPTTRRHPALDPRQHWEENQRQLASHLGVLPSRLVLLLDELEAKGLVTRQRSPRDRRNQQLQLTLKGARLLEKVEQIAAAHEADLGSALTEPREKP